MALIYIHIISLFTYLTAIYIFKNMFTYFGSYLLNQNVESVRARTMSSLKKKLYNFERLLYGYYKIFTIFPVVYKTRSLFSMSKSIHVAHGKIFILFTAEYYSLCVCVYV